MSRLTICFALIAAALVAVGCGGSNNKSSSASDQSKPTVAVTPGAGATAQAAAPTATKAKAKAKAAAKHAAVTTGTVQAKRNLQAQVATVKAAHAKTKSTLASIGSGRVSKKQDALLAKDQNGKLTKAEAKQLKAITQAEAKAVQKRTKLPKTPTKVPGKPGLSRIPGRVAASCQRNLRSVDGVMNSATKAQKLPGALSKTIAQLTTLGSTNSPAATGVTGDYAGMSRTQETTAAMQRLLKPAKAYAKSPSAANRAKLAQALKGLNNTAKVDALNSCAIA